MNLKKVAKKRKVKVPMRKINAKARMIFDVDVELDMEVPKDATSSQTLKLVKEHFDHVYLEDVAKTHYRSNTTEVMDHCW